MNVSELKEASKSSRTFAGTFIVTDCLVKPFSNKPGSFMTCVLKDKTGFIQGIIWDSAEARSKWLRDKMVVKCNGDTAQYKGEPQAIIKTIQQVEEYDPTDFIPALDPASTTRLLSALGSRTKLIENPTYKKIWEFMQGDHEMAQKYRVCPGGIGDVHHAYLGGLFQHSGYMALSATDYIMYHDNPMDPKGPPYDIGLAAVGCLVHDLGKLLAYDWDLTLSMNDRGRLLHHVSLGLEVLYELFDAAGIPNDVPEYVLLQHIIVSHHEVDIHLRPAMTPEAVLVSKLDSMDAAVNHASSYVADLSKRDTEGNWTQFCRLTDRKYYISPPPSEIQEVPEPEPEGASSEESKKDPGVLDGLEDLLEKL